MGTIEVVLGDITRQNVDAIVTAANESLLGGGGVDGAVHRAAGPRLAEAGAALAPCLPGQAVATPAFDLAPVRYVIHTVGPVWEGGDRGEAEVLTSCYVRSLLLAQDLRLESIAFPAIATGVYGFPPERAAEVAAIAVRSTGDVVDEIRLVAFDRETHDALRDALVRPIVERCPTCGARAVPIAHGGWSEHKIALARAGLVALGHCFSMPDKPTWECTADESHQWTNGDGDRHRYQAALLDALAVTVGEDQGRSVP